MNYTKYFSGLLLIGVFGCGGSSDSPPPPPPPPANNISPIIEVVSELTVDENMLVSIDASSSSDPDGTISTYQWTQVSGPLIEIVNANSSLIEFNAPEVNGNQQIILQLAVTDNQEATSTQVITIDINDLTLLTPNLTVDVQGNMVALNWTNSNATDYRIIYWREDGVPQEIKTESLTTSIQNLSSGSYRFIVEGLDELGNSRFSSPVDIEV